MRNTNRTKLLQVLKDGSWKYVFCHSLNGRVPLVTTDNYKSALKAIDLEYFSNKFFNNDFRVIKPSNIEYAH